MGKQAAQLLQGFVIHLAQTQRISSEPFWLVMPTLHEVSPWIHFDLRMQARDNLSKVHQLQLLPGWQPHHGYLVHQHALTRLSATR